MKADNLIEVFEIPYTTTVEAILDKVAELIKAGKLREVADMRDETDLSGLKLTIDLKRGTDPDKLMQKLFRATPLQDSFACNFNILVAGMPRVMGVREILDGVDRLAHATASAGGPTSPCRRSRRSSTSSRAWRRSCWTSTRPSPSSGRPRRTPMVVPNLMIGFGIDQVQAEYVADIRLRNINQEYILKRTAGDRSSWRRRSPTCRTSSNNPGRIRKVIIGRAGGR